MHKKILPGAKTFLTIKNASLSTKKFHRQQCIFNSPEFEINFIMKQFLLFCFLIIRQSNYLYQLTKSKCLIKKSLPAHKHNSTTKKFVNPPMLVNFHNCNNHPKNQSKFKK